MVFIGRSLLLLAVLYSLVFAIGDAALIHGQAPYWSGIVFVAVMIGAQYLISPWIIRLVYSIDWDEDEIPAVHRAFVERICREQNMPIPKLGIIESSTPNAFTFGRLRTDARIVITRGILEVCTEEEVQAVLGHELGHIANYDFAVMALASAAPLLLYQIYIWTDRVNQLRLVSYGAYVSYWIGQFLVLLLNRTREYGADLFSARVTHAPNTLSSALIRIAYGMVRVESEQKRLLQQGDKEDKKYARQNLRFGHTMAMMGIQSAHGSAALALGINTPEAASRVMRWDLSNPWARFYELNSTHPLTALRLRALNREAEKQGQSVSYPLPQDVRTRWNGFPVQFLIWLVPMALGFFLFSDVWIGRELDRLGVNLPPTLLPLILIALGITWAGRIAYRYRGKFQAAEVQSLLEDLDVSQMNPRAVEVRGEVIGNGQPGVFWSPDFVLRDESGMIYLYYRSSLPFGRLFFAIRNADRYIGEQVTVKGWYRRGLAPYIEISEIEAAVVKARSGNEPLSLFKTTTGEAPDAVERMHSRSWSRGIQLAGAALCSAIGILWLLGSLA